MFKNDFDSAVQSAENKLAFMKRAPIAYIVASMLAGAFVAFGGFVSLSVGSLLTAAGSPYTKLLCAFSFASALSLVIMAGSELFTGNNMIMFAGVLRRRVSPVDCMKLWLICWLGNYIGAWAAVLLFRLTGLVTGDLAAYAASSAMAKLSQTIPQMFFRGVLCNILVCLAVWCSVRMKSESGKLIMVFWCIFVFMVCGFEHSVANMSSLGLAVTLGTADFWSYVVDIGVVTMGNIAGGTLFVALPYFIVSRK